MLLSRGDWINLALCGCIVIIFRLAYELHPARPIQHTQDKPLPLPTTPTTTRTITIDIPASNLAHDITTTSTNLTPITHTVIVEHVVAKQARNRPRLVEVCKKVNCEKRWVAAV